MKKFYLPALLLLPFALAAQKSVDLDKYRFTVQFRSLPAMRIDSTYRTYHMEVEATKMMQPFFNELQPENTVRLDGWRRLPQNGHLSVNVKLGDLLPGDVSVKQRVVTTRNGNGQTTGSKIFYYQEVVYTFEAEAVITDYRGQHILDQQLAGRNYKRIYKSPEFALRALAEGYFVVNSMAITRELYRESVNRAMHALDERLNEQFGFRAVSVNDNMWRIDSRKHPEYSDWQKALGVVQDVLFSMDAATPITGAKEKAKPAIDYFERIKRNYSSSSRHDRKIRYACYYNLAVLYYYLDDPQAMMKEANGLVLNDFDPKDGMAFERTATWLRNLFQQNNIYTRHFPINTEEFRGPYDKQDVTVK